MTKEVAEHEVRAFERRVEKCVRQFRPAVFASAVTRRFRAVALDQKLVASSPPHVLIRALEANCAYYRPWYFVPLDDRGFADSINLFHDFDDPYVRFVLQPKSDLFAFMQFMHRTQLDLQLAEWPVPLGRSALLYCDLPGASPAAIAFEQKFGLSTKNWFHMCFTVYSATATAGRHGFDRSYLDQMQDAGISRPIVDAFLREVACTPEELGEAYRRARSPILQAGAPPILWSQLRPHLCRRPILEVDGRWLVPYPPLILGCVGEGLHSRFLELDDPRVTSELSRRFERYVGDIFSHVARARSVHGAEALKGAAGKSCDYAVEFEDVVLLIECKAVSLGTDYVTENAVLRSTATGEILDGHRQLIESAERIRRGNCGAISLSGRPILGIVATLGKVPSPNSKPFWEHAQRALQARGFDQSRIGATLQHPPQVLDIEAVEQLVLVLQTGGGMTATWNKKVNSDESIVGDWREFLRDQTNEANVRLGFWRSPFDRIVDELISPQRH